MGWSVLTAAVRAFRGSREFGDIFHGNARVAQEPGCSSVEPVRRPWRPRCFGELDEASFVGNGKDGAFNFRHGPRLEGVQIKTL